VSNAADWSGVKQQRGLWAVIDEAVTHASGHRPSMLQDVLARRLTEIGVLNGGIVQRGREAGIPVPLNQAVTALVNGLEQSWAP